MEKRTKNICEILIRCFKSKAYSDDFLLFILKRAKAKIDLNLGEQKFVLQLLQCSQSFLKFKDCGDVSSNTRQDIRTDLSLGYKGSFKEDSNNTTCPHFLSLSFYNKQVMRTKVWTRTPFATNSSTQV